MESPSSTPKGKENKYYIFTPEQVADYKGLIGLCIVTFGLSNIVGCFSGSSGNAERTEESLERYRNQLYTEIFSPYGLADSNKDGAVLVQEAENAHKFLEKSSGLRFKGGYNPYYPIGSLEYTKKQLQLQAKKGAK